jgi:hypothetical protein
MFAAFGDYNRAPPPVARRLPINWIVASLLSDSACLHTAAIGRMLC